MKKALYFATMALLLAACGGNPNQQNNQTADKAAAPQQADSPSAEQFAKMQELYENMDDDHGWEPLCKWQYVDLDGDGVNEVWMRDMAEEYGAFFICDGDFIDVIGAETDRYQAFTREKKDGKGYFCKGGPAGGPSYYTEVITLKDSRVTDRFYLLEVYGEVENATLNGEDIDADKAKTYREALPEGKELEVGEWNILDLTDYDRVPAHKNSAKEDKIIMDFITEMYNSSLYVEDVFLEEHCTPRMLQQLRDDYEYEGEGYANWDFRSESNDSVGESAVLNIEKIDGRYYYEANDAGYIFRNIISAFIQDGIVMFDGITPDATYQVYDPFADDDEDY